MEMELQLFNQLTFQGKQFLEHWLHCNKIGVLTLCKHLRNKEGHKVKDCSAF